MAVFVDNPLCPAIVRDAYLASLKGPDPEAEDEGIEEEPADAQQPADFEPLIPSPQSQCSVDIEQDDYMIALGSRLLRENINTIEGVQDDEDALETIAEANCDCNYDGVTTDDYDWQQDRMKLRLTTEDIKNAQDWVSVKKAITTIEDDWSEQYNPDDLNAEQELVYNVFRDLIHHQPGADVPKQLIDLSGVAGTGKTQLIRTILQHAETTLEHRHLIKVAAFTNTAASNFVGGTTLHRLLKLDVPRGDTSIGVNQNIKPLAGDRLATLQLELKHTKAIIIDEKSMVGLYMLYQIDQRLRQAKPHHADELFGGMTVMLVGDLSQLPPVGDFALYRTDCKLSSQQAQGRLLYQQFITNYELKHSMRQQGAENEDFRNQLNRMANGTFTVDDRLKWKERSMDKLDPATREYFEREATQLCSRKVDMEAFNIAGVRRTNQPILVVKAKNNNMLAAKAVSNNAGGLANKLVMSVGSKVVLTSNIWHEAKLLNGSQGTVHKIIFREGADPRKELPAVILVHFPDYIGPSYLADVENIVPVTPITYDWMSKDKKLSREMLPLILGYSLTIHKSQGNLV